MASLPQRPASQRRSPAREEDVQQANPPLRTDSTAFSTTSEDSQTLLLTRRATPTVQENSNEDQDAKVSEIQSKEEDGQENGYAAEIAEPRKCWICFCDETEDTPASSEWRSPCTCALTAHEQCLLDWIADMEAPSANRQAGGKRGKIQCPQCKYEYKIERPRSYVVEAVRAVERFTGSLILPGVMGMLGYTIAHACFSHGVGSVYLIFGIRDGSRILAPLYQYPDVTSGSVILAGLQHYARHWRLATGLSLIPTVLIAARTRTAAGDSILPILPIMLFATNPNADELLGLGHWPPSAALSFGMLPYVRMAYNAYYDRVWAEREKKWLKEIQPRAGEDYTNGDGVGGGAAINIPVGEDVLEINAVVEFEEDWEEPPQENANEQNEQPHAQRGDGNEQDDNDQNHGQQNQADQAVGAQAQGNNANNGQPRERIQADLLATTVWAADKVLGALVFPSIMAACGEILRVSLPKSWVTLPKNGKPTGFLQTRWGRSIVGAMLFVPLKDFLRIYMRWRMAQSHRMRRVVDYDQSKAKRSQPASQSIPIPRHSRDA
jgi:hypothetical protein